MVKKGPCFHCGINSTPIWRNGPPEKPVLCNACGSRYRLWANLDNYTPKHAQQLCNLKNVYSTKINIKNQHSSQNLNLPSIVSPKGKLNPSLWNCSPSNPNSKKKSQVVQKKLTPIQTFQKQMLSWWKQDKKKKESSSSSASASASAPEDEDLITQRVNKLIPEDEIGPGGTLLPEPDDQSGDSGHYVISLEDDD